MTDSNGHDQPRATVADVADHFGVSERTVRRWLKETDVPYRRVGAGIRFVLNEVDEWAQARADAERETVPPCSDSDDPDEVIYRASKADAAKQAKTDRRAS